MSLEQKKLERELRFYESQKSELIKEHKGKYVLIKNEDIVGFFDDYENALKTGLEKYGANTEFFIKQIVEVEPVYFVFRAA